MTITDCSPKPKFRTMQFSYINVGEVFEFGGTLYIRTIAVDWRNAVSLQSGGFMRFDAEDKVHQLHRCEITYEKCLQEEE